MTQYTLVIQNNSESGGDVCVYQTEPNISDPKVMSLAWLTYQVSPTGTLSFTWNPEFEDQTVYWVTFSTDQQGQVLDHAQITNAAKIAFPPNVYSMTATLSSDKTWTVAPTA